jgi:hypothetical protein
MKLSLLNQLLQSNRDSPTLVEPLLRVLMLMDLQVDESDSYADILNLLKAGILKYDSKNNG